MEQHNSHPTLIKDRRASRKLVYSEAVRLDYIASNHENDGNQPAQEEVDKSPLPATRATRNQICMARVQHPLQSQKQTHQSRRYPRVAGCHELDLDIAQSRAGKPGRAIRVSPDQGVDHVEEVEQDEPSCDTKA